MCDHRRSGVDQGVLRDQLFTYGVVGHTIEVRTVLDQDSHRGIAWSWKAANGEGFLNANYDTLSQGHDHVGIELVRIAMVDDGHDLM